MVVYVRKIVVNVMNNAGVCDEWPYHKNSLVTDCGDLFCIIVILVLPIIGLYVTIITTVIVLGRLW